MRPRSALARGGSAAPAESVVFFSVAFGLPLTLTGRAESLR